MLNPSMPIPVYNDLYTYLPIYRDLLTYLINISAIVNPIPVPPPVTNATFPL